MSFDQSDFSEFISIFKVVKFFCFVYVNFSINKIKISRESYPGIRKKFKILENSVAVWYSINGLYAVFVKFPSHDVIDPS